MRLDHLGCNSDRLLPSLLWKTLPEIGEFYRIPHLRQTFDCLASGMNRLLELNASSMQLRLITQKTLL